MTVVNYPCTCFDLTWERPSNCCLHKDRSKCEVIWIVNPVSNTHNTAFNMQIIPVWCFHCEKFFAKKTSLVPFCLKVSIKKSSLICMGFYWLQRVNACIVWQDLCYPIGNQFALSNSHKLSIHHQGWLSPCSCSSCGDVSVPDLCIGVLSITIRVCAGI